MTDPERISELERRVCQLWAATLNLEQKCLKTGAKMRAGSFTRITVHPPNPVAAARLAFRHAITVASFGPATPAVATLFFEHAITTVAVGPQPVYDALLAFEHTPSTTVVATGTMEGNASIVMTAGTGGTIPWANPSGAEGTGTPPYATVLFTTGQTPDGLILTGLPGTVPGSATIVGVTVIFQGSSAGGISAANPVSLSYLGADIGTNQGSNLPWSGTSGPHTYGGPTNLWGAALTPTVVNDPSFGVDLQTGGSSGGNMTVESVTIEVAYTY